MFGVNRRRLIPNLSLYTKGLQMDGNGVGLDGTGW